MDRLGVVGLNWRQGQPGALARYTLPVENRAQALLELRDKIGASELVYVATCNRVEWAFVTEEGTSVDEYRRRIHKALIGAQEERGEAQRELRAWQGEGAVEHIMLMTMGLDSAQVGESEILGQVRTAFELSRSKGLAREQLVPLFQEALKLARNVRRQTGLHLGRTSLAEIALDQVRADLARRPGQVALLGISPMTERCARDLLQERQQLLIVNRDGERAKKRAEELGEGVSAQGLEEFQQSPPPVAVVISATACEGPLLDASQLNRLWRTDREQGARPLLVDFATDPDLDPRMARELGFDRLGMPEMLTIAERGREQRLQRSGEARALVDEALQRMSGILGRRKADHAISAMRETFLAEAEDHVETLISKHFPDLQDTQALALRQFARGLAKRCAHLPSNGLRNLARVHGAELVSQFFAKNGQPFNGSPGEGLDPAPLFASLREGETQ